MIAKPIALVAAKNNSNECTAFAPHHTYYPKVDSKLRGML